MEETHGPDGKEICKKSVIKLMNNKVSLTKSTDRTMRVRRVGRHDRSRASQQTDGNVVQRAFRCGFDEDGGINSGTDQHKTGDLFAMLV